jgi:hypothetical protein
MGSASAFRYLILVGMKGISMHAHSSKATEAILGSSGAKAEIANLDTLNDPDDKSELFVAS